MNLKILKIFFLSSRNYKSFIERIKEEGLELEDDDILIFKDSENDIINCEEDYQNFLIKKIYI